jgi:ATP-dependent DNA helicase RecQ
LDDAQRLLETMLGSGATFRQGQREAIEAVVRERSRALVVQRTGWGKSLVYWIATRMLRSAGAGPTLLVSPLLSLMRNQIQMAGRIGVTALTINSGNTDEWESVRASLEDGQCDVLLVSPERFANEDFMLGVLPTLGAIGLLVVDEAHCISDWGHDFRPDYRRIRRIIQALPQTVPVLATTATANDRVVEDVSAQLGEDVQLYRGPLARESLSLHVIQLADQAERLAWLAGHVPELTGSGIIYCLTVADTHRVANWLRGRGVDATAYNADLPNEERERLEGLLINNQVKALVATVALGMGFDKPDLGFVIHYQRPGSVIAYYQQVGRAGRAVEHALAVLLCGREDDEISEYFIETAFPPVADMEAVLAELATSQEMTVPRLESRLNMRRGQVQKALKMLELDGAVARERGRYFRTPNRWTPDVERIERVTAARYRELEEMRTYTHYRGCLMEFLVQALDDPDARPCGHCANDGGPELSRSVDPDMLHEATAFLRRDARTIQPRKMWPSEAASDLRGRIQPQNMPAMALCIYGDAGWGRLVADGKYKHGRFDPSLIDASIELIESRWRPTPPPTWVTSVPSARHPGLVGTLARKVAEGLGLPFVEVLASSGSAMPQKSMQNSAQQVRNVRSNLQVVSDVPTGPALLIDDIIDSGWTMTYAGWLLSTHGASAVHPFALAVAANRGDSD